MAVETIQQEFERLGPGILENMFIIRGLDPENNPTLPQNRDKRIIPSERIAFTQAIDDASKVVQLIADSSRLREVSIQLNDECRRLNPDFYDKISRVAQKNNTDEYTIMGMILDTKNQNPGLDKFRKEMSGFFKKEIRDNPDSPAGSLYREYHAVADRLSNGQVNLRQRMEIMVPLNQDDNTPEGLALSQKRQEAYQNVSSTIEENIDEKLRSTPPLMVGEPKENPEDKLKKNMEQSSGLIAMFQAMIQKIINIFKR